MAEDAKAMLAVMLTSKHVAPLREEAASWAVKLKEVGEVLEQVIFIASLLQRYHILIKEGNSPVG